MTKWSTTLSKTETQNVSITDELHAAIQLHISLPPDTSGTIVLIFGIEFIQTVKSGDEQAMKDASANAMAIVAVEF